MPGAPLQLYDWPVARNCKPRRGWGPVEVHRQGLEGELRGHVEEALATRYWEVPEMKERWANELRADVVTVGRRRLTGLVVR